MKVTIVGAGNVGASCAEYIAQKRIASKVVLLDIKEGFAEGKALDLLQTATTLGFNTSIKGVTNDYAATSESDVVVITSGIPRKPGMTREELIGINAGIVQSVSENILKYSPNTIIIVVSNPMDTMTYLDKPANDIHGFVIGGHGDTTMIPLTRLASYNGVPVSQYLDQQSLQKVAANTMVGGATLTKLLGTSAWYAPGASVAYLVDSVLSDQKRMIPCSVYLEGEYGLNDICIGVPCIVGANGVESIVDVQLNTEEKQLMSESAEKVLAMNAALSDIL